MKMSFNENKRSKDMSNILGNTVQMWKRYNIVTVFIPIAP